MKLNDLQREKLKKALGQYNDEYCDALPSKEELQHLTVSKKHQRKIKWLLDTSERSYFPLINTTLKRVACVIVATLVALTAVTFGVDAFREKALAFIESIFSNRTELEFGKDARAASVMDFTPTLPAYIPDGFEEAKRTESDFEIKVTYENSKNDSIIFAQQKVLSSSFQINTESSSCKHIEIDGRQAVHYTSGNMNCIVLNTGEYYYWLNGEIAVDELITMAESIF